MTMMFQQAQTGARLSEQVAEALAGGIRDGAWAPGSKLPTEAQLAKQFKVSRTVVREAMSQLKSLGLVESRQGYGVLVLAPGRAPLNFGAAGAHSVSAVVQMAEVRRGLEAEAAGLAALRRDPAALKAIHAAQAAVEVASRSGSGVDEDVALHRSIAQAAGNPYLLETMDYLAAHLRGAVAVSRAFESHDPAMLDEVNAEHAAIVDAIAAGDAEAARQAATRHMDQAIRRIQATGPEFWLAEGYSLAQALERG
ncbi:FadR family transcriptional regulator [Chromobacterium haemolyticum]|uniref:FadR family transcriptional regulator n=2 Tax=Chromobacterium fluminis TaxID=3044269 RepID=A0ABX0L7X1_9NEIS|nr:FadR family transcriptional regulator [Chromobacterium haemolyticum]